MISFSSLGPASVGHLFRFLGTRALSRPSGRAFLRLAVDLSPARRLVDVCPICRRTLPAGVPFRVPCRPARVGAGFPHLPVAAGFFFLAGIPGEGSWSRGGFIALPGRFNSGTF